MNIPAAIAIVAIGVGLFLGLRNRDIHKGALLTVHPSMQADESAVINMTNTLAHLVNNLDAKPAGS